MTFVRPGSRRGSQRPLKLKRPKPGLQRLGYETSILTCCPNVNPQVDFFSLTSCNFLCRQQAEGEGGAAAGGAFGPDGAVVLLKDRVNHRQPQAGAVRFRGDEGIEDLRKQRLRNPRVDVRNPNPQKGFPRGL